jgi:hypothetical protein
MAIGVSNPVSVSLVSPIDGSTVSNTVTLTANASSTMGPIVRVEFYVDGALVAVGTNPIAPPSGLRLLSNQ